MTLFPRAALAAALLASATFAPARATPLRAQFVEVPSVRGIRDVAPLRSNVSVRVGLVLRNRHEDEFERDVALVSTKGSKLYHHFVTREGWNDYFAPSAQTARDVAARLSRAGFAVERIAANRGVVDAVAPASVVERYFQTQLHTVAQPGRGLRFRNATAALIPSELLASVETVTGLDTIERFRLSPHPRLGRRAVAAKLRPAESPQRIAGGPFTGPDTGYGPAILTSGYRYPSLHGFDGRGTTVGITIPDTYLDSDTQVFLKYFNIKETGSVRVVPVDGGFSGELDGEATLDTETIATLAPGAAIDVYEFPDFTNTSITDTFNAVVSDDAVDSVSNSWGGCETDDPVSLRKAWNVLLQQAALKGITVIFSSGDYGAYSCDAAPAVSSPASQPYVTAIGGTHFNASPTGYITSQTAEWYDAYALIGPGLGSGGGVSSVWPLPAYQAQVRVSTRGRNVPDFSLPGDVEDSWYVEGEWYGPIGGTSWAAPAFNAMLAEVDEEVGAAHGQPAERGGFINPALYAAAASSAGGAVFTDIERGNNGANYGPGFVAGPGYDLATGLGTPVGYGLVGAL